MSASDIDLGVLLPGHQSPIEQIMLKLRDLGGRYHRYLHQDEFGPTRAERMAALRPLLDQLDLLLSRLNGLPEHLRLRLANQFASRRSLVETDIDSFHAHCNDLEAVDQIEEVAAEERRMLHAASASRDAGLMNELSCVAEKAVQLLSVLDTTAAAALAIDTELSRLEIDADAESAVIGFAIVRARIERLQHRAERTLADLECQTGPERGESLQWLVWQLCDLYHNETGQLVTSSPRVKKRYEGIPQSPAGQFVLTAVKALQPPEAWAQESDHLVAQRRARILDENSLNRRVYYAMREYVSHHPSVQRRGRRKAK